jgi:hypothetical protein
VGVHFVNFPSANAPLLTFGTYTVLNVNRATTIAEMSTKCTPAALPSAVEVRP